MILEFSVLAKIAIIYVMVGAQVWVVKHIIDILQYCFFMDTILLSERIKDKIEGFSYILMLVGVFIGLFCGCRCIL
jgi:hypothetical protein